MEGKLILEVLDRFGRVRERVRVDSFPFVIGRAYHCDLILDDRFVSPEHLRLERDESGEVTAEDLGSTNSVWRTSPHERLSRAVLRSGDGLRLGNTELRFRSSATPVEAARRFQPASSLFAPFVRTPARCVATFAAAVPILLAGEYLSWFEAFGVAEILIHVAQTVALLIGWAGLWALATRFLSPRSDFLRHFAVAAAAFVALTLFLEGMEYVAFNAERWSEPVWWAVLAVILAAVLDGHLRLFASAPPKRVAFGATAASLAIVGLSLVISVGTRWQQERWSSNLPFSGYLKPPSARVVRSHSLDEFFVVADRLRSEVDRLATEKR